MKGLKFIPTSILIATVLLGACQSTPSRIDEPEHVVDKTAVLNLELGLAYMEKKDYKRALNKLRKALKIDPQYSDAHNTIAILYSRLGEDDQAGAHFKKAVQTDSANSGALNNYGQYLCTRGESEKAMTMFSRALENPLYSTPQFAHINAGICAKNNKNLEQAEIHFRSALKRTPRMAAALFHMADVSYGLKRYMPARGYIERYAEVARHNAASLLMAVKIEKALGDVDAEASYGLRLKNKFPDSQETRLLLEMEGK